MLATSNADLPETVAVDSMAGRSCPLHYRYRPTVFARPAEAVCEVLYVVGGLYGNAFALEAVLALFDREAGVKHLVFNGDFNWFDTDPATFERLNRQVLGFDALRGNVETELAASEHADGAPDAGCGCAYPDWVGDAAVGHSNAIMRALRCTASGFPEIGARLAALPMHRRVDVGGVRVAVVHGDAESLAGWGFAQEHLREAEYRRQARRWFEAAQVDLFACSHTCLPVFHGLPMAGRTFMPVVLNNGAAGMPNFIGRAEGLLTRIAVHPFAGPGRRFGLVQGGLHLDAVDITFDTSRWQRRFLADWPETSDAHASYWQRISQGPDHDPADALVISPD